MWDLIFNDLVLQVLQGVKFECMKAICWELQYSPEWFDSFINKQDAGCKLIIYHETVSTDLQGCKDARREF